MIAIFMAKFCDKIIVLISFLVPENQILTLSPKIAYNYVTDEFSIIVTPYVAFFDNFFFYYRCSISATTSKAKDVNIPWWFFQNRARFAASWWRTLKVYNSVTKILHSCTRGIQNLTFDYDRRLWPSYVERYLIAYRSLV